MGDTGSLKLTHEFAGWCPICERDTRFVATREGDLDPRWYKNWYDAALLCEHCSSYPRQRTLFEALRMFSPNWRDLMVHECSPDFGASSYYLRQGCVNYVATQYDKSLRPGEINVEKGYRCEDLEHQTFPDDSFDLVISQAVFEHIFRPDLAIKEIARTLKPGGYYIMTVPWGSPDDPSVRRASLVDGVVIHHMEPIYHGNPVDDAGSLVTIDWGHDIAHYLAVHSGMSTSILFFDDLSKGMRGASIDVVVCRKIVEVPVI